MRIKSKKFEHYVGKVYDLAVDNSHSYNVEDIGVHNSSAGSLVCYCLGITDLDPLKYGLMFERFLDPSRKELPDIDLDFQDVDIVKDMLRDMFGGDNVACLSSYGTFQVKGLMKDLSRVYDLDHGEINKANKKIESELKILYKDNDKSTLAITLDDLERVSPTFNAFMERYPNINRLFKKLYGKVRHIGRHASGVIVGDDLPSETAVFTSKGVVQTSFTEGIVNKNISAMGFVKLDILSIATLGVIDGTLRLMEQRGLGKYEDLRENLRPHKLDMNDLKVMKQIFWKGNTDGIFQVTSSGMQRLFQKIKPDCFDDISAAVSLYRPGPLGSKMDKLYGENKKKAKAGKLEFEHPLLESILKETYGCLVYQEQLMKVCQFLGKMELKDVQRVRKQLLKKDKSKTPEFLKKEAEELSAMFIKGCQENGLTESAAEKWWKNLLFFGNYGFNCLSDRTPLIIIRDGRQLTTVIGRVRLGDMIRTRDEKTRNDEWTEIVNVFDNGEREMVRFVLDTGERLTCTWDHKFRTTSGKMLPIREIVEKNLEIVKKDVDFVE